MHDTVLASDALNFDAIIDAFYQHGWVWLPHFLNAELNAALLHEAQHEAELTPAGIGRLGEHQVAAEQGLALLDRLVPRHHQLGLQIAPSHQVVAEVDHQGHQEHGDSSQQQNFLL